MSLHPTTRQALETLVYLGLHGRCEPGVPVPLEQVAEFFGRDPEELEPVGSQLVAAGLLAVRGGSDGGVQLAVPAEEIRLLDVVLKFEGGLDPVTLDADGIDPGAPSATLLAPLSRTLIWADRALEGFLAQYTLDQLLPQSADCLSEVAAPMAQPLRHLRVVR